MMLREYERTRKLVDEYISSLYKDKAAPWAELTESMAYSLTAGGKRIRPVMALKFSEASGGDMQSVLPIACAIELVHTYSLIHDDLPCMDNDDLRRGKPTNHRVYGECTAVLAGDALQADAFALLLSADLPDDRKVKAASELAVAAGSGGICGGQLLDMKGENKTLSIDELEIIHSMKTASMIRASARIGVIAGGGSEE